MGAGELLAQALGIALNLRGVFGLQWKGGKRGFKLLLELNSSAQVGKLLVVLAHRLPTVIVLFCSYFVKWRQNHGQPRDRHCVAKPIAEV